MSSATSITVTLHLTPEERLALEHHLSPGTSRMLDRDEARRWGEATLRAKLAWLRRDSTVREAIKRAREGVAR